MNTIIAAIDFSECSINALQHALSIVRKARCNILMVWVQRPDAGKEDVEPEHKNILSTVENRFEDLIRKYNPNAEINMAYKIRQGKVYQEIVKEAKESKASLIIAGTHGSSGFEEFWVGSNANKIVTSTYLPVITIRAGVDVGVDLKKMVLPIDSTPATRQKIIFTALLAGLFNAEVHVLSLYTGRLKAQKNRVDKYSSQVVEYLKEEGIAYKRLAMASENVTNTTIDYAQSIDANLISIMTEQEHAAANIILGPYAAQMVNHSPIPVLSIHPQKLKQTLFL